MEPNHPDDKHIDAFDGDEWPEDNQDNQDNSRNGNLRDIIG